MRVASSVKAVFPLDPIIIMTDGAARSKPFRQIEACREGPTKPPKLKV
jgi:hypothetical protein